MNIEVVFRHNDVNPESLRHKNVVIIDVLRATSVLVTALYHGAQSVQTVAEVAQAFHIQKSHPDVLLVGERHARKVDGFHLGNSPLEMKPDFVKDQHVVMSTSNGSQAVFAARFAKTIYAAAFVNMSAVADVMLKQAEDFTIICSGTNGNFSLDDGLAAGLLVNKIMEKVACHVSDGGLAMALAVDSHTDLKEILKDCHHLKLLQQRGFQDDVDYCLTIDSIRSVPKYVNGKFIL
jgi:2-phosphosulfolactate phosphatase